MDSPTPPYVYYERDRYEEEDEIDLVELFKFMWKKKGLVILLMFLFGAAATIYAFTAPFIYRAECRVIPPGAGTGGGLLSQFGALASLAGMGSMGKATGGGMAIGILKGDTVVDAIIDKFNLMKEMEIERRLDARKAVIENLETNEDATSGIVSIAWLDKDPQKAADIANAFVDQLQAKLHEISVNQAQETRMFFEDQMLQAQQELSDAETAMMKYQQSSGVLALESQTASMLASIASLRNQIAAKNVEISSLSSYTRKDNPRLRLAQSQLEAMTKELKRLEEEQKRSDRQLRQVKPTSGDLLSSLGSVPELSVEYQRYVRTLRIAAAKYESMMRQYENARLSEASDLSTLQIVDRATPPDWKYKPKRGQIMIIGTMLGFVLGSGWLFVKFMMAQRNKDENEDED
ncbi:MAG: hypothetical protein IJR98_01565 [Synergistaceae bacterium]|nr:hypothetical protein [Synergistaceae bacterium]